MNNELTGTIIGAAIEVHRNLGPGLLESVYETCLAYELEQLGLYIERQKALPLVYKDIHLDRGFRIDLLIEKRSLWKSNLLMHSLMFIKLRSCLI